MKLSRPSAKTLRRSLTALALVFALGGAALIAYPFVTDLWAGRIQTSLRADLSLSTSADTYRAGDVKIGKALTRLEIPAIDLDVVVVEGTTPAALRAGAGHYPKTALPGEQGNVAIAGHRTTYGRPFNRMDDLKPGDKIVLTTPIGKHTYEVTSRPWVVSPTDATPLTKYEEGGYFLTLTSCHPEGSAAYRIIVRAELIDSTDTVAQAAIRSRS
ncbi:MAG: sortase [Actinomycetota bacterium]|jgi:sortase A|nr:sortase [Actinomycetota bacterium]